MVDSQPILKYLRRKESADNTGRFRREPGEISQPSAGVLTSVSGKEYVKDKAWTEKQNNRREVVLSLFVHVLWPPVPQTEPGHSERRGKLKERCHEGGASEAPANRRGLLRYRAMFLSHFESGSNECADGPTIYA